MDVELPQGAEITASYLVPGKEALVVGGYYRQKGTNGGRFHTSVQPGHTGPILVKTIPFIEGTADFNQARVVARKDGGAFLIGNAVREEVLPKKGLNISSISPSGELEWSSMLQRKMGPLWTIKEGFIAVERDGQLLLLFPDVPANLDRYRNGEDPTTPLVNIRTLVTLTALYDGTGNPSFGLLAAPEYTVLFDDMQVLADGHTVFQHAAPPGSRQDKNVAYAIIDLSE
jgi:hypothetical protein